MKIILIILNSVLCILSTVTLGFIFLAVPDVWNRYSVEPEDWYLLSFFMLVCTFVSVLSGATATRLNTKNLKWKWFCHLVIPNLLTGAILFILSLLGYFSNEVSIKELRFLVLPSGIFILSSLFLEKNKPQNAKW